VLRVIESFPTESQHELRMSSESPRGGRGGGADTANFAKIDIKLEKSFVHIKNIKKKMISIFPYKFSKYQKYQTCMEKSLQIDIHNCSILFHDNQGMIGVRSGRNPTMRHMERTHGISIASLHEHFQRDHFLLIYEITAKMAADIHTKGFKNPLAWKRACMLTNLLEPDDLGSKDLYDLVQPSTDVDTTTRQVFQSRTDDVPNFPYTETPALPGEIYVKGLTSKLGFQHVPGSGPIL